MLGVYFYIITSLFVGLCSMINYQASLMLIAPTLVYTAALFVMKENISWVDMKTTILLGVLSWILSFGAASIFCFSLVVVYGFTKLSVQHCIGICAIFSCTDSTFTTQCFSKIGELDFSIYLAGEYIITTALSSYVGYLIGNFTNVTGLFGKTPLVFISVIVGAAVGFTLLALNRRKINPTVVDDKYLKNELINKIMMALENAYFLPIPFMDMVLVSTSLWLAHAGGSNKFGLSDGADWLHFSYNDVLNVYNILFDRFHLVALVTMLFCLGGFLARVIFTLAIYEPWCGRHVSAVELVTMLYGGLRRGFSSLYIAYTLFGGGSSEENVILRSVCLTVLLSKMFYGMVYAMFMRGWFPPPIFCQEASTQKTEAR